MPREHEDPGGYYFVTYGRWVPANNAIGEADAYRAAAKMGATVVLVIVRGEPFARALARFESQFPSDAGIVAALCYRWRIHYRLVRAGEPTPACIVPPAWR